MLRTVVARGIGLECVSQGELEHVLGLFPELPHAQILFTPNFAPRAEYEFAFARGLRVTLDNLHPLREWGDLLEGREVFVRVDTGHGRGHHDHVRTAGLHSKFGVPLFELDELGRLARERQVRITGLHAHTGSGVFNVHNWAETAAQLAGLAQLIRESDQINRRSALAQGQHLVENFTVRV
ncbi:MAG: hypothetical protein HC872_02480 [Gammaproteobacteria bacterium]|nr:hypothetical protein [Gammaproteobacteria bacterium]